MPPATPTTNLLPPDWLDAEPAFDCGTVPAPLRALVHELASGGASRRTAVLWLSPASYAAGPRWAAHCLGLLPRHLGREVVATCEAQGTLRVPAHASTLLKHVSTAHAAGGSGGAWIWGLDALLTRLPAAERQVFWDELFALRQRPPLMLALPETFHEFGPSDPERWQRAEPCRGLVL